MKFQSEVKQYWHDVKCRSTHCCQDKQTAPFSQPVHFALTQPHLYSVIVSFPFSGNYFWPLIRNEENFISIASLYVLYHL